MVRVSKNSQLSVIIPTLNESRKIPLLLADLNQYSKHVELLVIDGGSSDLTVIISNLFGAKVINSSTQNRGDQLCQGALNSKGDWLLFIHADSRLTKNWFRQIHKVASNPSSRKYAWYFDFKVKGGGLGIRILELAVFLRSHLFKKPYGDQGLLISKELYTKIGGYKKIPLMEDLEIITKLNNQSRIRCLNIPIYTDGRKWYGINLIIQAWKNARLRYRWIKGESPYKLAKEYYE